MNNNKTMIITMPDGSQDTVETLLTFKFNDNNKEYVIYTKNPPLPSPKLIVTYIHVNSRFFDDF